MIAELGNVITDMWTGGTGPGSESMFPWGIANGIPVYRTPSGDIVDSDGGLIDSLTGNLYADEVQTYPVNTQSHPNPSTGAPGTPAYVEESVLASINDTIHSAATGTLTDSQKASLVQQEHDQLVKAGMPEAQAAAAANSDVTKTLIAANADPSQASFFNSILPAAEAAWAQKYGIYLLLGAGALVALASRR